MHPSLRTISNMLELWKLCPRAQCARGKCCKGNARHCIERLSRFTPREDREFIVDVLNAREFGHSPEAAVRYAETDRAARACSPAARS